MDDLERLARELHRARDDVDSGWINNGAVFFGCGMQTGFNIADIKAKRDDLSGKPDRWIHDWATHRQQLMNGDWIELSDHPHKDVEKRVERVSIGEVLGDWRDTLEERAMEDKAEWVDGFPPAGTVCEIKNKRAQSDWARPGFYKTTIVAIGEELMIINSGNSESACYFKEYEFRPIKSDKEKAIEEMLKVYNCGKYSLDMAEALYDAGMYRPKEEC